MLPRGEGAKLAPLGRAAPLLARVFAAAVAQSLVAGCGAAEEEIGAGVESIYVVPESLDALAGLTFFDHPWPSDLRLEEGSPRFEGYYNPRQVPILDDYITSMKSVLDGFSPNAAGFLRFAAPIDRASLPRTPAAALDPAASVQLLDIDPASPEHGARRLVSLYFQQNEGVYFRENTLAFIPTPGFPLRPRTRYALVVTDALQADAGGAARASADLRRVLGVDAAETPAQQAAAAALAPTVTELEAAGLARDHIVHLAVFTTNDPAEELFAFRDALRADVPAPVFRGESWTTNKKTVDYVEYWGKYGPSPNYQAGVLPFEQAGDGGRLNVVDGKPTVVDLFDLRFSLTVPRKDNCPMPDAGFPIALFAHGTGGGYRDHITSGIARELSLRCIASMGVDQIFHGERPGAPAEGDEGRLYLLVFNFQNVVSARATNRQSALDEVQRVRLFTESHATVPLSAAEEGQEVRFDPGRVVFFGHSQGGLNGPLFLAADDGVRGGVLSGSSGQMAITLLEKTRPEPSVATLVKSVFLALKPGEDAEVNLFHPAISLAQMIVDVADPLSYARYPVLEPRAGFAPKSYLMTEGINPDGTGDSYAPPAGIEALALGIGLPPALPAQRPLEQSAWGGPAPVVIPEDGLAGNLAGGAASGVLMQWPFDRGDGHFVVFDVPEAKQQAVKFLANLSREPAGRVPSP
jgi:hypothetical protein